ncbi:hypothetical protein GM51_2950 [freshwater metagenome]|uniref:Methyltransferase type 11 domain-containing protein n=1 Tax=freshwater metagenome TaxID=449393 RepID=A0A094QCV3_9ZZZZ
MKIRFSELPSKQLCLFLLASSPELRSTYHTGLDVASNKFNNRGYFNVNNYIAIDIEDPESEIPTGPKPSVDKFIHADLLEAALPSADLVMCVETVGITALFSHSETLRALESLINTTNTGGTLVVNVGPLASVEDRRIFATSINSNFTHVRHIRYGRWSKSIHPLLSLILGTALLLFPSLRVPNKDQEVWHLFFAKGKLAKPQESLNLLGRSSNPGSQLRKN